MTVLADGLVEPLELVGVGLELFGTLLGIDNEVRALRLVPFRRSRAVQRGRNHERCNQPPDCHTLYPQPSADNLTAGAGLSRVVSAS